MEKISYQDKDLSKIIRDKQAEGLVLTEVQNHEDGNFLIFKKETETELYTLEKWIEACPDGKMKEWLSLGKKFFK